MNLKLTLIFLLTFCGLSAHADVTGDTPVAGSSYYIYNVGQKKYLSVSASGTVELSSTATQFTVASGSVTGCYTLTADGVALSSSFHEGINCSNNGYYDQWKFSLLSSNDKTYALGVLEDEDAYACTYLYYSTAISDIAKVSAMPDINDGRWLFTTSSGETIVTLDESATSYALPQGMSESVTVKLNITALDANKRNTICLPFSMDKTQIEAAFGVGTIVYEYTHSANSRVYYRAVTSIEAGKPYVVRPTSERSGDSYVISGILASSFVSAPTAVKYGSFTFNGTFVMNTLSDIYTYTSGKFSHYSATTSIPGFRACFTSSNGAKLSADEIEGNK